MLVGGRSFVERVSRNLVPTIAWIVVIPLVMRATTNVRAETELAKIEQEWRRREVGSFEASWIVRRVIPQAVFHEPNGTSLPTTDLVLAPVTFSLSVDGGRTRYDSHSPVITGTRKPTPTVDVFDGADYKNYSAPGAYAYGFGTLCPSAGFREINNLNIWPLLLTWRPLAKDYLGISFTDALIGDVVVVRGAFGERSCIPISWQGNSRWSRYNLWLDRDRNYTVAKLEKRYGDIPGLRSSLDIDYDQDVQWGWIPARWRLIFLTRDSRIESLSDCEVNECRVGKPIPMERFHLEFPRGTVVENVSTGEKWINLGHGKRRIITQNDFEQQLNYEDILHERESHGLWWVLAVGTAPVVLLAVWLCWRAR